MSTKKQVRERKELFCGTYEECVDFTNQQPRGLDMEVHPNTHPGPKFIVYWKRKHKDPTIRKTVSRLTRGLFRVKGVTKDPDRPLVVSLEPGDVISFRPQGTQQKVGVPIKSLYNFAVFTAARAVAAAKKAKKKGAK